MNPTKHSPRLRRAVAAVVAVAGLTVAAQGVAQAADDDSSTQYATTDLEAAMPATVFQGDAESDLYDHVQKWKKDWDIPVEVGAWHWWHRNRKSPHDFHYGTPGLGGTYYYYVHFDPTFGGEGGGTKMGVHIDARFRDGEESFRPFFTSNAWLWEAYGWADVGSESKVKLGKIWRRFGLDWDGCWYGNVAYFDGWKLDPDWGASYETTIDLPFACNAKAATFAQVFVAEDRVNGSISGADPESQSGSRERLSASVRTVPTWTLGDGSSIALGLSAQAGNIDNSATRNHSWTAGAVDLTWTKDAFKVFGEYMESKGIRNPTNYVTGGPSDHSRIWELGAAYQMGPVTFRGNVSHGAYDGPNGQQVLYLLGVTVAVTKNIDLYVEYVRWDTETRAGPRALYEDGYQFVVNWRF